MEYNKNNPLRVFTAFSGYDSQCLALNRIRDVYPGFDYTLVGWSEIDKNAIIAHNALFEEEKDLNSGDISKIDWNTIPDFDLFTYSFPCTDISTAGKQEGLSRESGTRSSLLWECEKAIKAKRPKYLLMENVKNLLSRKFVQDYNAWQLILERYGYKSFGKILNAEDYGVPQHRERVFLVSVRVDDDETPSYSFPKPFPLEKKLKDIIETNVDERYYLSDRMLAYFERLNQDKSHNHKFKLKGEEDVATAIKANPATNADDNFFSKAKRVVDGKTKTADMYELENGRYALNAKGGVACTLTCAHHYAGNITHPRQGFREMGVLETGYKSCALRGRSEGDWHQSEHKQKLEVGTDVSNSLTTVSKDSLLLDCKETRIRKLTERENFRLMGVDDSDIDKIQACGISNTAQRKLAGNSIVVDVLFHIFRKMFIEIGVERGNEPQQLSLF